MKKALAVVVCAVALAFVMGAPPKASAGGVSIYIGGGGYYGGYRYYRYPRYAYGYRYPRYGYRSRYRSRYRYRYPRYGNPRARSYVRRGVRRGVRRRW